MMRVNKLMKYISGLLTVIIIFAAVQTMPVAAEPERKVIKVAYPLQECFTDIDKNGNYYGYTYEYLMEIAQYTGWEYEFVQVPGDINEQLTTLMKMVENDEVDLMGATLYSEALDEQFDYSAYGYGTFETVLKIPVDLGHNLVIEAFRPQTLRVAVKSKTGRQVNDLNDYCRMNLITPILIEYDTDEESIEAIRNGEADVLLSTSVTYSENLRTIASFSPRQFYFITANNNTSGILSELNEAMANLSMIDPYYQSSLYDKYFAPEVYELLFTAEEKKYIENSDILKVGVLTSQPPFQYKNLKENTLNGIGVEVIRNIFFKAGLQFELIEVENQEKLYEMLSACEIDVIAGMPYDYLIASEKKVSMTRPYVTSPYILLLNEEMSKDNIEGKRLALSTTSAYKGDFFGIAEHYDSVSDCITAVNSGKADYTYVDTYTAQYFINLPEFDRLKMVPQTFEPFKICFGISVSADRSLYRILNKAILSISDEDMQSIINMNTIQKQSFSLGYYVKRNPVQAILISLVFFMLILMLIIIIFGQRLKSAKALKMELQKHRHLYSVTNDLIFEYDYKKKIITLNLPKTDNDKHRIINYDLDAHIENSESEKSRVIMLKLLESGEDHIFEERLIGTDNKWHWFRIVLEKICDKANKPVYAFGRLNIIDAEKSERDELLEKSQRDSLTHLYNNENARKQIETKLSELSGEDIGALIIFDIDFFKSINDTYGHMKGDSILCGVSELLRESFSEDAVIGRMGGDEFIIYMTKVSSVGEINDKCRDICQAIRTIMLDDVHHITISMGAVLTRAGISYTGAYQAADDALYEIKNSGRDNYKIKYQI